MSGLKTLLDDHQLFHSDFQLDALITVRAGGTPYGCYKQAIRELWKRYRGLKDAYSRRATLQIDIEELCATPNHESFEHRRRAVELAAKRLSLMENEKCIEDTEREFARFYAQASRLKAVVGDLSPARRADLDAEMWLYRIKCQISVDLICTGRLGPRSAELLHSCPSAMRREVCALIRHSDGHSTLVEWYLSYVPNIPDISVCPKLDVPRLIDACESACLPMPYPNLSGTGSEL